MSEGKGCIEAESILKQSTVFKLTVFIGNITKVSVYFSTLYGGGYGKHGTSWFLTIQMENQNLF